MSPIDDAPAPAAVKLPFEPRTLLVALWRRRKLLATIYLVAAVLGASAGLLLGKRTYEARTVMLFKPAAGTRDATEEKAALRTLINLVKIESNLSQVRKDLSLTITLADLAKRVEVTEQGETKLVVIQAQWNDAEMSARLANRTREVFLDFLAKRREELRNTPDGEQTEMLRQLSEADRHLREADDKLQNFLSENRLVDLDKQINRTLEEKSQTELLYQQAQIEEKTNDLQLQNLDRIIADLTRKANEEAQTSNSAADLGDINIKFRRLRDAIHDDRAARAQAAELAQREGEYQRAQRLFEKGALSQSEMEKIKNALDRQKALSVDTDQIKQWKSEIAELDKVVIPKGTGSATPSGKLLSEMMLRSFEVQLKHVALAEKVAHLQAALEAIQKTLDNLTQLQRQLVSLRRAVQYQESEKHRLEQLLAMVKTSRPPEASKLDTVSEAEPPVYRSKSTRKPLAAAVFLGISLLATAALLGREALRPIIRSSAELKAKLELPILAQLPQLAPLLANQARQGEEGPLEQLPLAARRLRNALPKTGARLLVASALAGEGRTLVAISLAAQMGRQEERVLLMETQVRPQQQGGLRHLAAEPPAAGLGEYLSFQVAELEEAITPSRLPGVDLLPRVGEAVSPDLLGSQRMRELMEALSGIYSIIIIDGSPALINSDAQLVSRWVDAVVLVVEAERSQVGEIKRAMARLRENDAPVVGCILNQVRKPFLEIRSG